MSAVITLADAPLTRINFQATGAQCEIYLYVASQGGYGSLGWTMCGDIFAGDGVLTECTVKQN